MIPPFDYNMFNLIAASTSDYGRGVNRGRRERITYTRKQLEILEDMFRQTHYPDVFKRENLSALLGIPEGRIQVWFKNRRARYRQTNRNPFHSNNTSMDNEDLKIAKTELPEIHRSPSQATPGSSSSSSIDSSLSNQSISSPSSIIGIPKIEATYDDYKQHQQQQLPFNPAGFDNLKDFYSMQIPMNGNFWQTPNWQNPSSYYPVPYPTTYHSSIPTTNPASFYGYPQASAATAAAMQQSYQQFYPSYPVGNPGYPEVKEDAEETVLSKPK
uniref:Homeobox domain-containing protein n=1 Tax=Panagrolaimus sp. ES5 TaxID=591445 RepID=A0AC34FKK9_9BILA